MCAIKKKDNHEIIKCQTPTVEINNRQNIQVNIIKTDNKLNNKKKMKEIKEYKDKPQFNNRGIAKQNNILTLNKFNKNSLLKEKKEKQKIHKSYNNLEYINLSKLQLMKEPILKIKENETNILKPQIVKAVISDSDKILIKQSLQNNFLFKNKNPQIINQIIDSLEMRNLVKGTTLFKKGDKGNYFYIVKEGKLELITEYGSKILNEDDNFGELALIENKKRTATVKCLENCTLYLLNGKIFREIVTKVNEGE